MKHKKLLALLLGVLLALGLLTGCGRGASGSAAAAAIAVQGRNVKVRFVTSSALDRALSGALLLSSDPDALGAELARRLGLDPAEAAAAGEGQSVIVVVVTDAGLPIPDGAAQAAAKLLPTLNALPSGGQYQGAISMVQKGGRWYAAAIITVVSPGGGIKVPVQVGDTEISGWQEVDGGSVSAEL